MTNDDYFLCFVLLIVASIHKYKNTEISLAFEHQLHFCWYSYCLIIFSTLSLRIRRGTETLLKAKKSQKLNWNSSISSTEMLYRWIQFSITMAYFPLICSLSGLNIHAINMLKQIKSRTKLVELHEKVCQLFYKWFFGAQIIYVFCVR